MLAYMAQQPNIRPSAGLCRAKGSSRFVQCTLHRSVFGYECASSHAQEAHPSHRPIRKAHLPFTLSSLRLGKTHSWLARCLQAQLCAMPHRMIAPC